MENTGENLRLDKQLCFALYVCSKEIIRLYKPFLKPFDLTYTAYITLMALWERDGITVKELGSRLYLDSGTLTPLLKKMEAQGFVRRQRGIENERNVYLTLTEKGRGMQQKLADVPEQVRCSALLSPDDAAMMLNALHRVLMHNAAPA